MSFNPEKCEVIRITNKRRIMDGSYTIHGHTLQFTDQAKYLGVTIDTKLSWGHHTNAKTKKVNNTVAFLRPKKKIMFVSCNPTDPVWNPPTQNFLLTQGEKKRGKRVFDSCELISNQIDNFKTSVKSKAK